MFSLHVDLFKTLILLVLTEAVLIAGVSVSDARTETVKVPPNPDEIVFEVPSSVRNLRKQLTAHVAPTDRILKARELIAAGRREGDPRLYSYAATVIKPLLEAPTPDIRALLLSAIIHDHNHEFSVALQTYEQVLRREPDNIQALLSSASTRLVLGDFEESGTLCKRLHRLASPLVTQTCLAGARSMQGKNQEALTALQSTFEVPSVTVENGPPELVWSKTLMAEIAERMGQHGVAERHFKEAIAIDPADTYLLGAYADFLLTVNRHAEVIRLLEPHVQIDSQLVRLLIAYKKESAQEAFSRSKETLQMRFKAEEDRGSETHLRERVRFLLTTGPEDASVVQLAKRNWELQKEPIDLLLLAAAAGRAGNQDALSGIKKWVLENGYQDVRLERILKDPFL